MAKWRVVSNDSEFTHYGVLGMKWGVRRTPEQLGHRTIKAGTKMYRTSASSDESDKTGSTYVTYLPPDRDMYRGAWANNIRTNSGLKKGDPLYETEYVLKEDLNIPSREEQIEVVNKLREKNGGKALKDYVDRRISDWTMSEKEWITRVKWTDKTRSDSQLKDEYKKLIENYSKEVVNDFKNMSADQFFRVVSSKFGVDEISREEVIKELSKRGYNAMVDQASIGGGTRDREGVDAMIIFDRNKTLESKKTKKISKLTESVSNARYMNWYRTANNPRYKNQPW